jgi:hypothetical protein
MYVGRGFSRPKSVGAGFSRPTPCGIYRDAALPSPSHVVRLQGIPPIFRNLLHARARPSLFERDVRRHRALANLENPLRAKLTNDIASYPFWGSEVYSREQLIEYVQQAEEWAG